MLRKMECADRRHGDRPSMVLAGAELLMFRMEIVADQVARAAGGEGLRTSDPEVDSIESLLAEACEALADSERVVFLVEGFGQSPWPVDVRTDLLTIVEQLPEFLEFLQSTGDSGELDFYEQGVQRLLRFEKHGPQVRVECTSGTKWQPTPAIEMMPLKELAGMASELAVDFVSSVRKACPEIAGHPWFQEWTESPAMRRALGNASP